MSGKRSLKVRRTVHARNAKTGLWSTTANTAFHLSSAPAAASCFAAAIRGHWGIENRSRYLRDVTFGEDAARIRVNPGIFAGNILRLNQVGSISQDRCRASLGGAEWLLKMTIC